MSDRQSVLADALRLPTQDRAAVATVLLRSLDDDGAEDPGIVDAAWAEEIGRRIQALDAGKTETLSADEARRLIASDADPTR